ncbi:uncharacterized protein EI90DRAFT_3127383 [Cantharellus anzutake]|uniref:uncharacterized protein n=1 Tax=Cantharellus anzutake TaxID=1750568 RepID=UPI00190786B7|nr:uncharacterized protein EI90DRAFT_3127383 [Cantharellus anzutake]KAF8326959.1 hypothetical protein EI90DRAFT_3127383 [Cantharellus anzutake]
MDVSQHLKLQASVEPLALELQPLRDEMNSIKDEVMELKRKFDEKPDESHCNGSVAKKTKRGGDAAIWLEKLRELMRQTFHHILGITSKTPGMTIEGEQIPDPLKPGESLLKRANGTPLFWPDW